MSVMVLLWVYCVVLVVLVKFHVMALGTPVALTSVSVLVLVLVLPSYIYSEPNQIHTPQVDLFWVPPEAPHRLSLQIFVFFFLLSFSASADS